MEKTKKRNAFNGSIGFVLAAAGSAVGLEIYGDSLIWRQKTEAGCSCLSI